MVVDLRAAITMVVLFLATVSGTSACKNKMPKPTYDQVEVLPMAAGATRLLCSPNGRYVVAEIGGEWRSYAPDAEEVPPVSKLLDLSAGTTNSTILATVNGWALGAPADDGDLLYIEEVGEEYRYQIRSTRRPERATVLAPPDGYWLPRAALRIPGGPAVVVLWKPRSGQERSLQQALEERLWVAVIDPDTLAVTAARELDITSIVLANQRFDEGVAINPARGQLYLVDAPEYEGAPDWSIIALDLGNLHESWRLRISGRAQTGGGERNKNGLKLVANGQGNRLAVFYGSKNYDAIRSEIVHTVDTATGAIVATANAEPLQLPDLAGLYRAVPVPQSTRVALLYRYHHRVGMTESREEIFKGVWIVDLDGPRQVGSYQAARSHLGDAYERMRALDSRAMTVSPTGKIYLAPGSFRWAHAWLGNDWPQPTGDGQGPNAAEVNGLVAHPSWHRAGRPRVEERQAARDQARGLELGDL